MIIHIISVGDPFHSFGRTVIGKIHILLHQIPYCKPGPYNRKGYGSICQLHIFPHQQGSCEEESGGNHAYHNVYTIHDEEQ